MASRVLMHLELYLAMFLELQGLFREPELLLHAVQTLHQIRPK